MQMCAVIFRQWGAMDVPGDRDGLDNRAPPSDIEPAAVEEASKDPGNDKHDGQDNKDMLQTSRG